MSQHSKVRAEHEESGLLEDDQIEEEEASVSNQQLEASRPRFRPESEDIVVVQNVQKTYLLGIEGVAALRFAPNQGSAYQSVLSLTIHVRGVSMRIKRGEFVMLFGTSGGGKTSLLNIIGTIDKPTKGTVTVCGTSESFDGLVPSGRNA